MTETKGELGNNLVNTAAKYLSKHVQYDRREGNICVRGWGYFEMCTHAAIYVNR